MVSFILNWLPIFVVLLLIALFIAHSVTGGWMPSSLSVASFPPISPRSIKFPLQW